MSPRVLMADDHQVVREGFRAILERAEFQVVAEARDGWEAVRLARKHRPDVVIMDLSMPLLNGTDAAHEILATAPGMAIILLTVHVEEHLIVAALRAGVRGYVVKTQAAAELLAAIPEVLSGGTYLSPRVSGALVHAYLGGDATITDPLTPRERQVLQLVAEGKSTKDIAVILDLTVKTADYYRSRIMSKLNIHNIAGLVRYALRHGLIELAVAGCCWLPVPAAHRPAPIVPRVSVRYQGSSSPKSRFSHLGTAVRPAYFEDHAHSAR
jgi:DNA-binding NarL/FixJ family response regulator